MPSDAQHIVERRAEFRIPIMQHITTLAELSGGLVDRVARHLRHPGLRRMPGDAGQADAPGLQMKEEQDVVRGETTPRQHFDSEEVAPASTAMCAAMKSFQVVFWLRFGAGRDAMAAKNVADRLIRDVMAEIGERADDPIVTPAAVLSAPSGRSALRSRVDCAAVPGRSDVWSRRTSGRSAGDTRRGWCPVWRRRRPLRGACGPAACQFRRAWTARSRRAADRAGQVRAQDPILRGQVFALEQQALIHQTCHVRQQPCPAIVLHAESTW